MQMARCPKCGLSQLASESCKACGAHLGVAAPAAPSARPVAMRQVPRTPPRASRLGPYLGIWLHPRRTMRAVLDDDPYRAVILLSWLGGIADVYQTMSLKERAPQGSMWWMLLLLPFFMGPLAGFARTYVGGGVMALTGRWLGGTGDSEDCRAALAWSNVPLIAALPFLLPGLFLFDAALYFKVDSTSGGLRNDLLALCVLAAPAGLLAAWSNFTRWKCLAEAHDFSTWRGFLAFVLAWIVVIVPLAALTLVGMTLFPVKDRPAKPSPAPSAARKAVPERVLPGPGTARDHGRRLGVDSPARVLQAGVPPDEARAHVRGHGEGGAVRELALAQAPAEAQDVPGHLRLQLGRDG